MNSKRVFILTIIICTIIMTTILVSAKGTNGTINNPIKSYISIKITSNNTLWNIADEYMNRDYYDYNTYVNEVISINNLNNTTIYAGEQIIIPIINNQ